MDHAEQFVKTLQQNVSNRSGGGDGSGWDEGFNGGGGEAGGSGVYGLGGAGGSCHPTNTNTTATTTTAITTRMNFSKMSKKI